MPPDGSLAFRLSVATVLLGLLLSTAACSAQSDGRSARPRTKTRIGTPATLDTTTGTPTTTDTPTTETASTTTAAPPSAPPSPTGAATPELAAQQLYDAWNAQDRNRAQAVAEPAAVDGIWAAAPGAYRIYSGCDTGEFNDSGCLFRSDAGSIQVTMERRGTAWVAISVFYAAP